MPARREEYTLGVEEEYQIVDPETRELRAHGEPVLWQAHKDLGEEVEPEILTSTMTPVCHTLREVRAELVRLRREVTEAAAKEVAGSSPRAPIRSRTGKSSRSPPSSATRT